MQGRVRWGSRGVPFVVGRRVPSEVKEAGGVAFVRADGGHRDAEKVADLRVGIPHSRHGTMTSNWLSGRRPMALNRACVSLKCSILSVSSVRVRMVTVTKAASENSGCPQSTLGTPFPPSPTDAEARHDLKHGRGRQQKRTPVRPPPGRQG